MSSHGAPSLTWWVIGPYGLWDGLQGVFFFFKFFLKFYFIFKLYITVLVLPNIKMNPRCFLLQKVCLPNDVFCKLKIKCIFGSCVHQLKRRANSPDTEQQQNNLGPKYIFHSKWIIPILLNGKLWVHKHPGYCFPEQVNSSTPMYIMFCNSQGLRKYLLNQLT